MRTRVLLAAVAGSLALLGGSAAPAATAAPSCSGGYYKNVDGRCVRRPTAAPSRPAGASARCNDGTYSFSLHHSGTCSGHGGVAIFYR